MAQTDDRSTGGPPVPEGTPGPEGRTGGDLEFDEAWAGAGEGDDPSGERPSPDERPVFEDPDQR